MITLKKWLQGVLSVLILSVTLSGVFLYNYVVAKETAQNEVKHAANIKKQTNTSSTKPKESSTKKQKVLTQKEKLNQQLPQGVKPSDWDLLLVNKQHPLSEKYKPQLGKIGGQQLDKRVIPHYNAMAAAAKKAQVPLTIVSSYRSVQYQKKIYNEQIQSYVDQGKSQKEAEQKTADYMTKPGTSEHHTGLSLDVLGTAYYEKGGTLDEIFSKDKSAKWLASHCAEYGFIVRYPKGKETITNIQYEPWHLRYVGKKNAEYMTKHHLTLEEYVNQLKEAGR